MNLQNRQHVLGLVAAILFGALAGDRWILTPLIKSWEARSTRIEQLRKSVARGQSLLRNAQEIEASWTQIQTNTLSLEPSVAESQILKAFDAWSRESGVSISGLRPQWKRSDEEFATLECRADVSGSLPALTRFLFEAEQDPLGIRVDSVELTTRDVNGSQLTLALQVSGLQLKSTKR